MNCPVLMLGWYKVILSLVFSFLWDQGAPESMTKVHGILYGVIGGGGVITGWGVTFRGEEDISDGRGLLLAGLVDSGSIGGGGFQ